jgi:hypothetical protein
MPAAFSSSLHHRIRQVLSIHHHSRVLSDDHGKNVTVSRQNVVFNGPYMSSGKSIHPILIFSFLFLFNPVKDTSSTVSVSLSDNVISEFRFLLVLYVTFVLLLLFNVHSHSKSIQRNSIYLAIQIEKYVHRWTK